MEPSHAKGGRNLGPDGPASTFSWPSGAWLRARPPTLALFLSIWSAFAAMLAVPTVLWAIQSRGAALTRVAEEVAHVAASGARFTESTFGVVDVVLRRLAEIAVEKDIDRVADDKVCPSLVCSNNERLSPYLLLAFARPNGDVPVHRPKLQGLNVADRDYFLAQRERDTGLFVGASRPTPFMQGLVLPMSRRLSSPGGEFGGIVAAGVSVDLLRTVFRGLGAGRADAIGLLGANGRHLAGWTATAPEGDPGTSVAGGSPCRPGEDGSSPDGITSTVQVGLGNLSVTACRSTFGALERWREEVFRVAAAEVLLLLLPVLAFPAARRRLRRSLRQRTGLSGLVAGYSDVQFIIALKPNGRFVLEALTFSNTTEWGVTSARLVGRTTQELFPPAEAELVEADYWAVLATGKTRRFEREIRLGERRFVWSTVLVPLRDAGGEGYIYGAATDLGDDGALGDGLRRFTEDALHREDNERRRIARELHDTTGQNLIAAGFELGAAERGLVDAPPQVRAALTQARALIDASVTELRTLSYVLYPALLDEAGLGTALQTLAEGFSRRAGVQVTVSVADGLVGRRWSPEVELALYRVAQEALTNVQRHSGTKAARVLLRDGGPALLQLIVEDGTAVLGGAPGDAAIVEGTGIRGMRDRLAALEGTLTVSRQDGGIRVVATVPERTVAEV
ncbi:histidine kinase [Methylorubrum sp. GM97]|uniref:histidine kinase n=1 Tax=Methylorubrum sp. GM97 TaxID=2938232 RepID=UPI0021871467|nr:histidine kinase [Methylorubrum sp. GM97]BDL37522.1 hypothetical protein MSPGM_01120 [Methylorubrum sp. GM97]